LIFDTDDLYEGHDRMDLLMRLKEANPALKVTAFAVLTRCPDEYVESLPDWIEVVPHGCDHGDPPLDGGECRDWSAEVMRRVMRAVEYGMSPRWQRGFKAPGWVISDGCYEALANSGWWLADQHYNDHRRLSGIPVHCEGDGDHIHTHVQNVCGNGLEETFPYLLERVKNATEFQFVSEAVY